MQHTHLKVLSKPKIESLTISLQLGENTTLPNSTHKIRLFLWPRKLMDVQFAKYRRE